MAEREPDADDYEVVQAAWETSSDQIEELQFGAADLGAGPPQTHGDPLADEDGPARLAIGETALFRVQFAQPCYVCSRIVEAGSQAFGIKQERGWKLRHVSCGDDLASPHASSMMDTLTWALKRAGWTLIAVVEDGRRSFLTADDPGGRRFVVTSFAGPRRVSRAEVEAVARLRTQAADSSSWVLVTNTGYSADARAAADEIEVAAKMTTDVIAQLSSSKII